MENQNAKPAKKKKVKTFKLILTIIVITLVVLIAAVLIAVPAYISSDSGRKTILAKINQAVDGKALEFVGDQVTGVLAPQGKAPLSDAGSVAQLSTRVKPSVWIRRGEPFRVQIEA